MENILGNLLKKYNGYLYAIFRILVGLLFLQHGAQKLFGWFGAEGTVEVFSLMGLAGVIELFGGLLIVLGLLTRVTALIALIEMLVAYFMVHVPQGFLPILNGGEPALLFLAAFLILIVYGAKKWSLEKALLKKELF